MSASFGSCCFRPARFRSLPNTDAKAACDIDSDQYACSATNDRSALVEYSTRCETTKRDGGKAPATINFGDVRPQSPSTSTSVQSISTPTSAAPSTSPVGPPSRAADGDYEADNVSDLADATGQTWPIAKLPEVVWLPSFASIRTAWRRSHPRRIHNETLTFLAPAYNAGRSPYSFALSAAYLRREIDAQNKSCTDDGIDARIAF